MSTKTVKMLGKISGSRNGEPWPAVGGTIELPTAEADDLIASRIAVDPADVETATAPATETATVQGNRSVRQIAQERAEAEKAKADADADAAEKAKGGDQKGAGK